MGIGDSTIIKNDENISAVTCMTKREALITNERYKNENVIWGRPKGILYGNIPGSSPEQRANLYPDGSATYFVASFCLLKESCLILKGEYPHCRYFSFTIANKLCEGGLGNGYFLRGDQIIPDEGSFNPFCKGIDRDVENRNYTIRVVHGFPSLSSEKDSDENILYTGTIDNSQRVHLSMRIYLTDIEYDRVGVSKLERQGVVEGLPKVYINEVYENFLVDNDNLLKILKVEKQADPCGYTLAEWISRINSSPEPINAPCKKIPIMELFWNVAYNISGAFIDNPIRRIEEFPPSTDGGFANNPDTKYMMGCFSFSYGELLVIRGKLPSHPKTRRGEKFITNNNPQVQYFSVTTGASPSCGEAHETLSDEQIPVDEKGYYTIVVGWDCNRPKNATLKNRVGWLTPGIGEGRYIGARCWVFGVYIRYQNCNEGWPESPSNIPMPTLSEPIPKDRIVMKEYFPKTMYMSKEEFENVKYIS